MKMSTCAACMAVVVGATAMVASASVIIDTEFVTAAERQSMSGNTTGLVTNVPGSAWVWGAGWNWGAPFVPASWDGGMKDVVDLREEDTALGLSIASSGSYVKPTQLNISASIIMTGAGDNSMGVGFWSVMPERADGGDANSADNFTGIIINEAAGTLGVYANGANQGDAVSVGALSTSVVYTISYDVDTTTGAISNVTLDGNAVSGLSSNAFTDTATMFAGVRVAGNANGSVRGLLSDLTITAVPEPSAMTLGALSAGGLLLRRRKRA